MKTFDMIVIGFGKAGKTLASKMAGLGKSVALIEKFSENYGGTCINIGCIPTKTLIHATEANLSFSEAMSLKETVITRLRNKNEMVLKGNGVQLINAKATFVANKIIEISGGDTTEQLTAETIIINTGAVSNHLPIPGLLSSNHVVDSTGLQKLDYQPKRLGIIGGGNIGLEFASLFANMGSDVTVFESSPAILSRYEEVASTLASQYLEEDGVSILTNSRIEQVSDRGEEVLVIADGTEHAFDLVMYALGRKPATEGLGLETTDITLSDKGAIIVDEFCETAVKGVYAVGDVNGGPQFTYTSLDDFRIVFGKLVGNSQYSRKDRQNIPTSLFIQPPLSQVGLTEKEALALGLPYKSNELLVANMPRAHVNNDLRGVYKVLVNTETNMILGATLFGSNSHEIINQIKMAMDNQIPYTYLKNQLFTHPTMAENLNDVFQF